MSRYVTIIYNDGSQESYKLKEVHELGEHSGITAIGYKMHLENDVTIIVHPVNCKKIIIADKAEGGRND